MIVIALASAKSRQSLICGIGNHCLANARVRPSTVLCTAVMSPIDEACGERKDTVLVQRGACHHVVEHGPPSLQVGSRIADPFEYRASCCCELPPPREMRGCPDNLVSVT